MTTERQANRKAGASLREENERLRSELALMRDRLREPEEILRAIRFGEVDGFVVSEGEQRGGLSAPQRRHPLPLDDRGHEGWRDRRRCRGNHPVLQPLLRRHRRPRARGDPRNPRSTFPGSGDASEIPGDARSRERGGAVEEIELLAANGSHVPVAAAAQLLSIENAVVFGFVLRDLTKERLQERLAVENRRKDEFLAILGHELRGPLDPIRNAIQFLQLKGPDEPELRWARDIIDRQVQHMTRLVDDLLDLGRIGQGKLELRLEQHTLQDLVNLAVENNRSAIEAREHRLVIEAETEPLAVQADPARLNQVLSNLFTNAAKFTPPGGRIALSVERDGDTAAIRVSDNGMGIPKDRLGWIFDLFAQLDSRPEGASGGLGIGLSLVRRLVEMHGGTVEASSAGLGTGAEFVVRLPLSAPGGVVGAGPSSSPTATQRHPLR